MGSLLGKGGNTMLDPLEIKILSTLLFEETFEHILEDSGEKNKNIVSDVLRTLIVKDLVRVYEKQQERYIPVAHIEPDSFKGQYFRITSKGLKYL